MKKFCAYMKKHAIEIINYKKEMLPLPDEEIDAVIAAIVMIVMIVVKNLILKIFIEMVRDFIMLIMIMIRNLILKIFLEMVRNFIKLVVIIMVIVVMRDLTSKCFLKIHNLLSANRKGRKR